MKPINENKISDKAAKNIAKGCRHYQSKFCRLINNMLSTMSPARIKTFLIIFCLVSSGLSIYIVLSYDQPPYVPPPIKVPAHFKEMGTTTIEHAPVVTTETYRRIQSYKKIMDSLDLSIEKGLRDSIALLENIYQLK